MTETLEQKIDQHEENYDRTIKNCLPEEYASWVTDLQLTLADGNVDRLKGHSEYVLGVYNRKKGTFKPAHSDSVK